MRVVIRADASLTIGSGHVMRCLTLAEGLRKHGAEVSFVCRAHPGNIINFVSGKGFAVDALPAPEKASALPGGHEAWIGAPWDADAVETAAAIAARCGRADWLVVDHYGIDGRWESKLRGSTAARILVVDDLADRAHECDLLLDQNIPTGVQDGYAAHLNSEATLLLGPKYLLLRSEFAAAPVERPDNQPRNQPSRALVFFGGADSGGITLKLLHVFAQQPSLAVQLRVLVGQANTAREEIRSICETQGHEFFASASNVAELIAGCDMAIAACGFFSYELMALRTPALLTAQSDIQWVVAKALQQLGVALAVAPDDLLDGAQIPGLIERTLALGRDAAGFDQVSVHGVDNVVQEMEKLRT